VSERFVCGCVITFNDGGPAEEQVLGRGTYEECEQIDRLIGAISYSGERPVREARFVIAPEKKITKRQGKPFR